MAAAREREKSWRVCVCVEKKDNSSTEKRATVYHIQLGVFCRTFRIKSSSVSSSVCLIRAARFFLLVSMANAISDHLDLDISMYMSVCAVFWSIDFFLLSMCDANN